MTPITNEKRELMIAAKKRGEKENDIAEWLEISVRSVSRIWKQYSETKSIQSAKPTGRKPSLDEAKIEELCSAVKRQPDLTLEELIDELELPIKKSRLAVILDSIGLSFKKRLYTQKSDCAKIFKKNAPSGLKS